MNSARIFESDKPIKLREKHYPPPENMLNVFIIQTTRGHIIGSLVAGSILVENLQYSDSKITVGERGEFEN